MNRTILFVVSFFAASAGLAQQASTATPNESMKATEKGSAGNNSLPAKGVVALKTVKLGDDELDTEKVYSRNYVGHKISENDVPEVFEGNKAWRKITKTAYGMPNSGYFIKVENHILNTEGSDVWDEVKAELELYTADGVKILDKELTGGRILSAYVLKNGTFLVEFEPWETPDVHRKWGIYTSRGELLYESPNIENFAASPQADYLLLLEKTGDEVNLKKLDLQGNLKVLTKMSGNMLRIKGISDNGSYFLITDVKETAKITPSGNKYWAMNIMCFSNDKLIWIKTLEAEGFSWSTLSRKGSYVIIGYSSDHAFKEINDGAKTYKIYSRFVERFKVINTSTWEIIYDGLTDDKLIREYKTEILDENKKRGPK